ncbi:hypothetical protein pb186bvf_000349 [Paramecium bursaria]
MKQIQVPINPMNACFNIVESNLNKWLQLNSSIIQHISMYRLINFRYELKIQQKLKNLLSIFSLYLQHKFDNIIIIIQLTYHKICNNIIQFKHSQKQIQMNQPNPFNLIICLPINIYFPSNKIIQAQSENFKTFNLICFHLINNYIHMVKCQICQVELPDKLSFQKTGNQYYLEIYNAQKPYMLIQDQNGSYYNTLCSQKCSYASIISMSCVKSNIEQKFDLIFQRSQITQGIIEKITNLREFIGQEVTLTENVFKKKANLDINEEFGVQISKSIQQIVDNITNELIQHLEDAIKFSMSETEKINCIKKQVEQLLKDQGNINLLNHNGYLNLCEEDIKKYRVDEMIQLMEKIQSIKKQINQILSPKK